MTVAQARRQAEISADPRAERTRWITALEPAHTHATAREAAASDNRDAHQRRTQTGVHNRQQHRMLDREQVEDLDTDAGLSV